MTEFKNEPLSPLPAQDSDLEAQLAYFSNIADSALPVKQEFPAQHDLMGINDLLELQMPPVDLLSSVTYDLGLDTAIVADNNTTTATTNFISQAKTSYNNDLSHLDFGNPFESSVSDWNALDFGLHDLM